ncbi:hypothetical protein [Paraburkholderia diazotrophica]
MDCSIALSALQASFVKVVDDTERIRADARQRHGWIMDTYLLKTEK